MTPHDLIVSIAAGRQMAMEGFVSDPTKRKWICECCGRKSVAKKFPEDWVQFGESKRKTGNRLAAWCPDCKSHSYQREAHDGKPSVEDVVRFLMARFPDRFSMKAIVKAAYELVGCPPIPKKAR